VPPAGQKNPGRIGLRKTKINQTRFEEDVASGACRRFLLSVCHIMGLHKIAYDVICGNVQRSISLDWIEAFSII